MNGTAVDKTEATPIGKAERTIFSEEYVTMRSKPIWLKSIICGVSCWVFLLLLIFVVYIMDFFEGAFFVGLPCGIIIALVTSCDTLKRTIKARVFGILSALLSQFLFTLLGIPYAIILYIYRNTEWVQYSGRLSVNETIGYGWGRFFLGAAC
jgi:uncharacterized membrane protein